MLIIILVWVTDRNNQFDHVSFENVLHLEDKL